MAKDFVRRINEEELIKFAMEHIVPSEYKMQYTCDESYEPYLGIFFANKGFLGINKTPPIFIAFEDFVCGVYGNGVEDKYVRREMRELLQKAWKTFMIQKFGEKYVRAYKTHIKEDFELKRIRIKEKCEMADEEEKRYISEIDELFKNITSSENEVK